MGSGIAAHLANLGFTVTLLDQTADSARAGWERAKAIRPPHLYEPSFADRVRIGGLDEGLAWIPESDWVCEAIIEKLDAKRDLLAKIEPLLRPDALVSTNTSGLEIALLLEGRSPEFRRKFVGTHFFNPPRYLKLLELIPTPETDPAILSHYIEFLENQAGRRVVLAKDTPGFIANRYGMWSMFLATHVAERLHLTIEGVDAITGPFLGRPRSGSFRLNDLVGMDIMLDIAQNLQARCINDPHMATLDAPQTIQHLMEVGHLGAKAGAGYYKKEGKELLCLDLGTKAYRQQLPVEYPSLQQFGKLPLGERLREALNANDEVGEFLRHYLIPVLAYAESLKEEISHNVEDFDRVMMWGFGWEVGPFALIDAIGRPALGWADAPPHFEGATMRSFEGTFVSRKAEPQFATIHQMPVSEEHETFRVRDLGDGVRALVTKTKEGTFNPAVCRDLTLWLQDNDGPFVLTSEGKNYSLGFDLRIFSDAIAGKDYEAIDKGLQALQNLALILRTKPVVAAIFGYTLGGGLETAMGCPQVIASPESNIGLPEIRVGLIPGGAGTCELRLRAGADLKQIVHHARSIMTGTVTTCAQLAYGLGYLRPTDVVATHPDRLLMDAKALALKVEVTERPRWERPDGPLTGMIDRLIDELGSTKDWAPYDAAVAEAIKNTMTKSNSWEEALVREREEFLKLCHHGTTVARIDHMLEAKKPLRN